MTAYHRYIKILITSLLLTGFLWGCKATYAPPEVSSPGSYLVVEGTINTGSTDSTIFTLSHTIALSGSTITATEVGAQVSVQDASGKIYTLNEISKGVYGAAPLGLPAAGSYRLVIKRSNGSIYQSDFIQAKTAPPIDDITFQPAVNGLHVFLNAHDAANSSRYYRWSYAETWQFHSAFQSAYIAVGDTILKRTDPQIVYTCFSNDASTTILLNSTTKLAQDVVSQQPITTVDPTGDKLNYIYSIQIKQYALTEDAFNFWQNLKRNTEQLGSIFDAQPSQLAGNIHNTANAAEPVIGYVSAGTVTTKRAFFKRSDADVQISLKWVNTLDVSCQIYNELYKYYQPTDPGGPPENQVADYLYPHLVTPIAQIINMSTGEVLGYTAGENNCVDCTTRGTTVKPSFWPY